MQARSRKKQYSDRVRNDITRRNVRAMYSWGYPYSWPWRSIFVRVLGGGGVGREPKKRQFMKPTFETIWNIDSCVTYFRRHAVEGWTGR